MEQYTMDKLMTQNNKLFSYFIGSFLFFAGIFFTQVTHADAPKTKLAGTQLAYYVGHHGAYHGGGYRGGYRGGYGYRRGYVGGYRGGYYNAGVVAAPVVVYGATRANTYWTPWKYVGHGCRRSCLVNKWNNRIIRCKKRCG
jgi:hypothetical protein